MVTYLFLEKTFNDLSRQDDFLLDDAGSVISYSTLILTALCKLLLIIFFRVN